MNDSQSTTFAAFGCTHVPLEDDGAIEWLLGKLEEFRPDKVIHLGDMFEADSASRWPSEYDWTLADEFKAAQSLFTRIREVTPDSDHIFLEGNHDSNIIALNRIDKKLRDLVDYRERVEEIRSGRWRMPCRYINDRDTGVFRIGQVTFGHGYRANASADELQSITLGMPYGLWVGGHTHRPVRPTQALRTRTVRLPYWYSNAGTLRDIWNVPYMERKDRSGWGQGLIVGEAYEWRYSESLMPQSKMWDAELHVRRMFDETNRPL